ncbi:hypothetical protein M8818_004814 [Zalaria obscura]|uniref:Uncharacterized protein n=1 Tax=Zalaria obscura TaxID=2024903 RepID=A0ACC3SBL1_9PEZI
MTGRPFKFHQFTQPLKLQTNEGPQFYQQQGPECGITGVAGVAGATGAASIQSNVLRSKSTWTDSSSDQNVERCTFQHNEQFGSRLPSLAFTGYFPYMCLHGPMNKSVTQTCW